MSRLQLTRVASFQIFQDLNSSFHSYLVRILDAGSAASILIFVYESEKDFAK